MEMEDNLSAAPFHIKQQLISRVSNRMLLGHLLGHENHIGYDIFIVICQLIDASDMSYGNNKYVDGCVGMNIPEGHHRFPLIDKISRLIPLNDLTKRTIPFHRRYLFPSIHGSEISCPSLRGKR